MEALTFHQIFEHFHHQHRNLHLLSSEIIFMNHKIKITKAFSLPLDRPQTRLCQKNQQPKEIYYQNLQN